MDNPFTNQEILNTKGYLDNLEADLVEHELTDTDFHMNMQLLYKLIERLMDETYEAKDDELKAKMALLELKARKCLDAIRNELGVYN